VAPCFPTLATAIAPKSTVNNKGGGNQPESAKGGWCISDIALPVGEIMGWMSPTSQAKEVSHPQSGCD